MNILTFSTHEGYQYNLAKTGHNFYILELDKLGGVKGWDYRLRPKPDNVFLIQEIGDIKKYNLVLYQTVEQYNQYKYLDLPKLILFHVMWSPDYSINIEQNYFNLGRFVNSIKDIPKIFINHFKQSTWKMENESNSFVIQHGIDVDEYLQNDGAISTALRVCHFIKERDWWCGYNKMMEIVKKDIPFLMAGNNPSISNNIFPESFQDLKSLYKSYRLFLYSSDKDSYPICMLEAMASGMPIVTVKQPNDTYKYFKNDDNAIISNDIEYLREKIKQLLMDISLARRLGERAKETVVANFNIYRFLNQWNEMFEKGG